MEYDAIAIDYDGTLISLLNRGAPPSPKIVRKLGESLENGIPVVIITGRGGSLLKLLPMFADFDQNLLFYATYNGTEIYRGMNETPIISRKSNLTTIFRDLQLNPELHAFVCKWFLTERSIRAIPNNKSRSYMDSLCVIMKRYLPSELVARNSGYSVDIYPKIATKDHCIHIVQRILGDKRRFLRVGDQGHEYGNDFEMLDHLGGFSVGTVSAKPITCFPVVDGSGRRRFGPDGALSLLQKLDVV